eukprot:gene18319-46187_t
MPEVYHQCAKVRPRGMVPGRVAWKDGVPVVRCGCLFLKGLGEMNCRHRVSTSRSTVQPTVKGWEKDWNTIHLCTEHEISVLQKVVLLTDETKYRDRLMEPKDLRGGHFKAVEGGFEHESNSGDDSPDAKRQRLESRGSASTSSPPVAPAVQKSGSAVEKSRSVEKSGSVEESSSAVEKSGSAMEKSSSVEKSSSIASLRACSWLDGSTELASTTEPDFSNTELDFYTRDLDFSTTEFDFYTTEPDFSTTEPDFPTELDSTA